MNEEKALEMMGELLLKYGPELVHQLVDIVHSKAPDALEQFELRRKAFYEEVLQRRVDERFGG